MRLWAESFGILDFETRVQGTGRSETERRRHCRGRQKRRQDNVASPDHYIRAVNVKVSPKLPFCGSNKNCFQRLSINLQLTTDCRCQYICTYNSVGYDLFLCIFRKHHPCSAVDSRCVDQDRERGYERDSHGSSRRFRIVVTREGPHGPSYFFDGGVSNYGSNMGNAYSLGERTGKVEDGQNLRKTESSSVGQ